MDQPALLLLVFNRPAATRGLVERVLAAGPRPVYVAADGPRPGVEADVAACAEVRAIVQSAPMDVRLDLAPKNLGLRRRVESAIDWVFVHEASAIVLEDDCWPGPDFFRFADAMLHRFEDDHRVGAVAGSTAAARVGGGPQVGGDYHFSAVGLPWGWGTWRRAWRDYDRDLASWPELRRSGWLEAQVGPVAARQWATLFDHADRIESWWIRWQLTHWAHGRWAVVPKENLVENVGGGADATHTRPGTAYASLMGLPVGRLADPIEHPRWWVRDAELDRRTLEALLPFSARRRRIRQIVEEGPYAFWRRRR